MNNPMAVQWLRLCASTEAGSSSIPGRGTKIPEAAQQGKKKRKMNDFTDKETFEPRPEGSRGVTMKISGEKCSREKKQKVQRTLMRSTLGVLKK